MTLHPEDWLSRLPGPPHPFWPDGARAVLALQHGTMQLELYAPRGHDPQQPHTRDEIYLVISGQGFFDNGGQVQGFRAGDAIFVPAGRPHRFVDFSDDFATWVVFYGPEGGET